MRKVPKRIPGESEFEYCERLWKRAIRVGVAYGMVYAFICVSLYFTYGIVSVLIAVGIYLFIWYFDHKINKT